MPKIFLIKNRLHQQQLRLAESQSLLGTKDDDRLGPLSPADVGRGQHSSPSPSPSPLHQQQQQSQSHAQQHAHHHHRHLRAPASAFSYDEPSDLSSNANNGRNGDDQPLALVARKRDTPIRRESGKSTNGLSPTNKKNTLAMTM